MKHERWCRALYANAREASRSHRISIHTDQIQELLTKSIVSNVFCAIEVRRHRNTLFQYYPIAILFHSIFIFIRFDSSVFSLLLHTFGLISLRNIQYTIRYWESKFNRPFNLRFERFLLSHRFYIVLLISFILERIQFLFVQFSFARAVALPIVAVCSHRNIEMRDTIPSWWEHCPSELPLHTANAVNKIENIQFNNQFERITTEELNAAILRANEKQGAFSAHNPKE